ncbi:hypothetical protein DFJ74DRAFT_376405 [Hyaloraphidium curvatum]|nr:hypothetical protein DFJ74DRAFT_376405 [Hyaloraphidium curvatum]
MYHIDLQKALLLRSVGEAHATMRRSPCAASPAKSARIRNQPPRNRRGETRPRPAAAAPATCVSPPLPQHACLRRGPPRPARRGPRGGRGHRPGPAPPQGPRLRGMPRLALLRVPGRRRDLHLVRRRPRVPLQAVRIVRPPSASLRRGRRGVLRHRRSVRPGTHGKHQPHEPGAVLVHAFFRAGVGAFPGSASAEHARETVGSGGVGDGVAELRYVELTSGPHPHSSPASLHGADRCRN